MKMNFKKITGSSLIVAGILAASASFAATQPSEVTKFNSKNTTDVFTVKTKGWSDPAFGGMGWTHSSDWGSVVAKKGENVTIKVVSQAAGIHPGVTVWYRGIEDTAPDSYVVDHFYSQYENFIKIGATDETTGEKLGNIVMRIVARGYDLDGNTKNILRFKGVKDEVPGQFELTFKAPKGGAYMFVVGGFNPDEGVDNTPKYNVDVTVTKTAP
jgi:hypothetical protein